MKPTTREILIFLALGLGFLVWQRVDARREGRLQAELQVADSVAGVRLREQGLAHDSAVRARLEADSLRAAARREVRRDAIAEARTDSTLRTSAAERDRARAVLADSLSTTQRVRTELRALVERSAADSAAFAQERQQHARSILALTVALDASKTAVDAGVEAENKAIARAVAAERQRDLLKSARPSLVGTLARNALWLAAGYGLGQLRK